MSFSRILYMICVNGGYLVPEIFNNIDRKNWREIKETLQWPPMENQLLVCTLLIGPRLHFTRPRPTLDSGDVSMYTS